MTTLQASTHTGRLEAGDAVLAAAGTTDTRPVAAKLAAFRKAHVALRDSTEALVAAEAKLRAGEQSVAEADVTQDAAVDALADALVGIGQPRTTPFKGLATLAPSALKKIGYGAEATALIALAAKVRKRKGLTPAALGACKDAERAATAVLAAMKPIAKLEAATADARTRRDAHTQPWETAFSSLKRAAHVADDDGARGLFDTLFRATAASKKPRAKRAPAAPVTAPA